MDELRELTRLLSELSLSQDHCAACASSFHAHRPVYHNELHCFSTALTFAKLGRGVLPGAELRAGVLASIYHDANHRGASCDQLNVRAAVETWRRVQKAIPEIVSPERVEALMQATCAGFRDFRSPAEAMIHDADLLQTVKGPEIANGCWRARLQKEILEPVTAESSLRFVKARLRTSQAEFLLAGKS